MNSDLATVQPQRTELSIPDMMQAVVAKEITSASVDVMEKLIQMKRNLDADAARMSFNRAFSAVQRDIEPIHATRSIKGKDGTVRSTYVPYIDLRKAVDPILRSRGFSISLTQKVDGLRMTVTIELIHDDGHSIKSEYTSRGVSAPSNSDAQNDVGTNTTASRMCLCNLLGIVTDPSFDARMEGDTISRDEATALESRVRAAFPGDETQVQRCLKLADTKSFAEIRRAKYEVVCQFVATCERKTKPSVKAELGTTIQAWAKIPKDQVTNAVLNYAQRVGVRVGDDGKMTDEQAAKVLARAKEDIEDGRTFDEESK